MGQAGVWWVLGLLNISLLSTRLSVKLASSSAHTFDVSSWEAGQFGGGEGLQVGWKGGRMSQAI